MKKIIWIKIGRIDSRLHLVTLTQEGLTTFVVRFGEPSRMEVIDESSTVLQAQIAFEKVTEAWNRIEVPI